ncbi:hypothetical protein ACFLXA_02735 [Chloroflexota bacterium]
MRAQGNRSWIKLHIVECLEGSIRYQLEPDERSVWYDLLVFAAICDSETGDICDRDHRPFPHEYIASRLYIDVGLFERALQKCKDEGRVTEDEKGIHITHWKLYQSEYYRQKPYREKKKDNPDPDKYVKGKYGNVVKR